MNIQQLRQSLKGKWLAYYREHREWLVKLGIWVDYDGARRPSSSYILATLMVLEPRLPRLMPLVVELSSNPDRLVVALGLNFSPDDELARMEAPSVEESVKLLPSSSAASFTTPSAASPSTMLSFAPSGASNHSVNGSVATDLGNGQTATLPAKPKAAMPNSDPSPDPRSGSHPVPPLDAASLVDGALPKDAPLFQAPSPGPDPGIKIGSSHGSNAVRSPESVPNPPASPPPPPATPVARHPSPSPGRAIASRDEQCTGRHPDDGEDIWR